MVGRHEEIELLEGESRYVLKGGLYICPSEISADLVFLSIGKTENSTNSVAVRAERSIRWNIKGSEKFEVNLVRIRGGNVNESEPASAKLTVERL